MNIASRIVMTERYRDYDPFAWLYAHYWGAEFHSQAMGVLERLVLRLLPADAEILDLCCGDGRIARKLSKHGYRVTGIDGSEEMLKFARDAAPGVSFTAADARQFRLPARFHAVVCTFDSLNHVLHARDLRKVFRGVFRALAPGGYFAFDLNREKAYTELWSNTSTIIRDDAVSIARGAFDKASGAAFCAVTLFRKDGEAWERSDFLLQQKLHRHEDVVSGLRAAGFVSIASFDGAKDLGMRGSIGRERTFYLARKPARAKRA